MMTPTAPPPAPRPAGPVRLLDRTGSEETRRVARYVAVGVWNTAFGIALFAGLTTAFGSWMPYLVALLIMHVVTVLVAFALYRTFVFRVPVPIVAGFLRFEAVYLSSLAINAVLLVVLVEAFGVPLILAQAVALLTATAMTYVVNRRFTFARHRAMREEEANSR